MIAAHAVDAPRSPGQLLREALQSSSDAQDLHAVRLGISRRRLNEIMNERRSVTADSALRLARYLGTAPEFWLESQASYDLSHARRDRKLMREIEAIQPLRSVGSARPHGVLKLVGASGGEDKPEGPPAPAAGAEEEAAAALRREVELLRAAVARQGRELREAAMLREFLRGKGLLREAERWARVKSELQGMDPERG